MNAIFLILTLLSYSADNVPREHEACVTVLESFAPDSKPNKNLTWQGVKATVSQPFVEKLIHSSEKKKTMDEFIATMSKLKDEMVSSELDLLHAAEAIGDEEGRVQHSKTAERIHKMTLYQFMEWDPNETLFAERFSLFQKEQLEKTVLETSVFSDDDLGKEKQRQLEILMVSFSSRNNPFKVTRAQLVNRAHDIFETNGILTSRRTVRGRWSIVIEPGEVHVLNRFAKRIREKHGITLVYDPSEVQGQNNNTLGSHYSKEKITYLPHGIALRPGIGLISLHEAMHGYVTRLSEKGLVSLGHAEIKDNTGHPDRKSYQKYVRLDELGTMAHSLAVAVADLRRELKTPSTTKAPLFNLVQMTQDMTAVTTHTARHIKTVLNKALDFLDENPKRFRVIQKARPDGKDDYNGYIYVDGYEIRATLAVARPVSPKVLDVEGLRQVFIERLHKLQTLAEGIEVHSAHFEEALNALVLKTIMEVGVRSGVAQREKGLRRNFPSEAEKLYELGTQARWLMMGEMGKDLNRSPAIDAPH